MPEPSDTPEPAPGPTVKRSDAATVAQRVEEILKIILDGAQTWDVVQFATEKGWNLSERQIRKYIQKAREKLVDLQEKSRKQVLARHLAQRQALFARAVNAADLRTALAVVDSEAKLRGLFPKDTDRETQKLMVALLARIAELEKSHGDNAGPTSKDAPEGNAASGTVRSEADTTTGPA